MTNPGKTRFERLRVPVGIALLTALGVCGLKLAVDKVEHGANTIASVLMPTGAATPNVSNTPWANGSTETSTSTPATLSSPTALPSAVLSPSASATPEATEASTTPAAATSPSPQRTVTQRPTQAPVTQPTEQKTTPPPTEQATCWASDGEVFCNPSQEALSYDSTNSPSDSSIDMTPTSGAQYHCEDYTKGDSLLNVSVGSNYGYIPVVDLLKNPC